MVGRMKFGLGFLVAAACTAPVADGSVSEKTTEGPEAVHGSCDGLQCGDACHYSTGILTVYLTGVCTSDGDCVDPDSAEVCGDDSEACEALECNCEDGECPTFAVPEPLPPEPVEPSNDCTDKPCGEPFWVQTSPPVLVGYCVEEELISTQEFDPAVHCPDMEEQPQD